jgi:hypothetical protein
MSSFRFDDKTGPRGVLSLPACMPAEVGPGQEPEQGRTAMLGRRGPKVRCRPGFILLGSQARLGRIVTNSSWQALLVIFFCNRSS